MSIDVKQLVEDAMIAIGALVPGESASLSEIDYGRRVLIDLLLRWDLQPHEDLAFRRALKWNLASELATTYNAGLSIVVGASVLAEQSLNQAALFSPRRISAIA